MEFEKDKKIGLKIGNNEDILKEKYLEVKLSGIGTFFIKQSK